MVAVISTKVEIHDEKSRRECGRTQGKHFCTGGPRANTSATRDKQSWRQATVVFEINQPMRLFCDTLVTVSDVKGSVTARVF